MLWVRWIFSVPDGLSEPIISDSERVMEASVGSN